MHNIFPTVTSGLIFILFFALTNLSFVQRGPEYSRAKKEAENFLNSINDKSILFTSSEGTHVPPDFDQEARLTINDVKHLVCIQCGCYLSKTPRYCPICSSSFKDEFLRKRDWGGHT